ncbi:hypothetical protein B0H11DRAFT_2424193 [Mycena galericulata]|nr:hypothetical protein B0H11DRAFT_2424193 [Mycena galericulata]
MPASVPKLFQPVNVGMLHLQHRVVFAAPNATCKHARNAAHYGGYLYRCAGGRDCDVPGIWDAAQIAAWKEIPCTHLAPILFLQLWTLGRVADPNQLRKEDAYFSYVDFKMESAKETLSEIQKYVGLYAQAARNALRAEFHGVEKNLRKKRTDDYGGSIGNRAQFVLEIVEAVTIAIGADRIGITVDSPVKPLPRYGMAMADPKPTFMYLVAQIKAAHPDFASMSPSRELRRPWR